MVSKNEYTILSLLWESNKPLTRAEILEGTEGRSWNPASIHLILNSMISKGFIRITNEEVKYGRTYEPCITYYEYLARSLQKIVPNKSLSEICADIYLHVR